MNSYYLLLTYYYMFSEFRHAEYTPKYANFFNERVKCNESGLCGSPWSSPEVTITRVLTSLSKLHFPSSCTRTLIASSTDAHLWDSLSHTHLIIAKSCIAPADISERSHLSLFDHYVLTLDCFSRFGLISACLLTLLPALILCSCLSSDIPVTVTPVSHCKRERRVSGAEAVWMQSRSSVRPLHFHTGSVCSARLNSVFYTEWYYGDYEEGYDVDFAPRQRNSKKQ